MYIHQCPPCRLCVTQMREPLYAGFFILAGYCSRSVNVVATILVLSPYERGPTYCTPWAHILCLQCHACGLPTGGWFRVCSTYTCYAWLVGVVTACSPLTGSVRCARPVVRKYGILRIHAGGCAFEMSRLSG